MQADNQNTSLSRDVLAYIPVKIIPAITGLLSIVILTRNLTPEEYGRYSVVIAITLLLVQLTGAWLSNSVLYVYPEYISEKSRSEFRRQTKNLQLFIAIPAMGIAFFAIYTVTHAKLLALAGGILVLGQLMLSLMMVFLQSSRKIHTQAIAVVFQSVSQLAILCVFVFITNGKETSAVVAVALGFLSGIFVLVLANRKLHIVPINESVVISRELLLKLINYGLPMCLWFFATQFYTTGDRILLQSFGVTEQLGQYASFKDLVTGCAGFLAMPLLMASHPIIMAKWKSGDMSEEIERIISDNITLLAILFFPLIAMTHAIGYDLIIAMFGQRYAVDEYVMVLIVISVFISSITMYVQKGLEVTGSTLLMAKLSLAAAIFSAIANVFVIPKFGVPGSAVVVVCSVSLYLAMLLVATRKTLKPRIRVSFWFKLVIWLLLVQFTLRIFNTISREHSSGDTTFLLKLSILCAATILLYLSDPRIRRLILLVANCKKRRSN